MSRIGQQTSPAPTRHVAVHRRNQSSPSRSRSRSAASMSYAVTKWPKRLESDGIFALATLPTRQQQHPSTGSRGPSSELSATQRYGTRIRQLIFSSAN
jgi:hypothetical protein